MVQVDRTEYELLIKWVVNQLWEYLIDDSDIDRHEWEPRLDEDSLWYLSYESGELVGAYWAHRINHVTWQVHTHVLPRFWGKGEYGYRHSQAALERILEDTGALKIIAIIPSTSPQVLRLADHLGFVEEGRRVKSFSKDGELHDEVYLGLNQRKSS